MNCFVCKKVHPTHCEECGALEKPIADRLKEKDPRTAINCNGLCRLCQNLKDQPLRWRIKLPNQMYRYGCYFPSTDLNVSEGGLRGTGKPQDVEWL